ncbi:VWA domain-containing protein [Haladaptatus sp. CMAA 1911]|uniref:VWA domain-containing protein n=1 Tax=unclassified Haladaptatus TaxID=2622732 RepID=UPI0037550CF5
MTTPSADRRSADRLRDELVRFTNRLGRENVTVPTNGALAAARALTAVERFERNRVQSALRATLLTDVADRETFDRLFSVFWDRIRGEERAYPAGPADAPSPGKPNVGNDGPTGAREDGNESGSDESGRDEDGRSGGAETGAGATVSPDGSNGEQPLVAARYSPSGDGERVSAETLAVHDEESVATATAAFTRAVSSLPGRRWEATGRGVDARRALRRSVESGGVPLPLPGRARKRTATRGAFLVDVSQSVLDTVDRGFLLQFLREVRRTWRRTPVFFFDTRLREVSSAFDEPTLHDALAALEAARTEWGGGTRIGAAVGTVRDEYPDAVDWRSTVVILSDGLERGDTDDLSTAMAWLSRRAGRVLWLNPLAVSPAYEPACRGMQASLPYLDGLYGFTNPDDLHRIADELSRHGPERTLAGPRGNHIENST